MPRITRFILFLAASLVVLLAAAPAALAEGPACQRNVDGLTFESSRALFTSDYFKAAGLRCGTPELAERLAMFGDFGMPEGSPADCSATSTNPDAAYDPSVEVYNIPVVVHIIMNDACTQGVISDEMVDSQIDILNEDFLAIMGSNGEPGEYTGIQFALATEDPDGTADHRHHPRLQHHLVQRWRQLLEHSRLGSEPLPEHLHQRGWR